MIFVTTYWLREGVFSKPISLSFAPTDRVSDSSNFPSQRVPIAADWERTLKPLAGPMVGGFSFMSACSLSLWTDIL